MKVLTLGFPGTSDNVNCHIRTNVLLPMELVESYLISTSYRADHRTVAEVCTNCSEVILQSYFLAWQGSCVF